MGFGFVEYKYARHAKDALKTLQGHELHDHALALKASTKTAQGSTERQGKVVSAKGSKLLVRNVPFEATKNEVRELFASFGQLKSVRMPSKFDGTHRGFAFVEMLTDQEAKSAFESLSGSTHLYGRRLVLEWAKGEDTVEEMRAKTAKSFEPNQAKRKKLTIGDNEADDE
eukprot:m.402224 g.402224  ORF g.402224 m.402224 type:complete len:170 (-) comp56449_c0_seq5:77-586(-)